MRPWLASFAIFLMIKCLGFLLVDSKEYLKGAITVDKMNSNGEIEAITFHFKDFPYNVTTGCHLSSKNITDNSGFTRSVLQENNWWYEEMDLNNMWPKTSSFGCAIFWNKDPIDRDGYIYSLVSFCRFMQSYSELAKENTTTAITFYPKIIDNKTCTVLEYTGLLTGQVSYYYNKPTNVVALFMPLNETKEGCDKYLILCSGNQTADWLDSVKVSKTKKITATQ